MKRNLCNLIILLTAFFSLSTSYASPEAFTLDSKHSYVLWTIKHLGFSEQVGKWYVSGQVVLDQDHPDQSKVDVRIKIADLATGLPDLDKHLKSPLFFNVEQFPQATFVSDKIQVLSKSTAKVQGLLTLRGVTKPVILDVTLNKSGVNPITNNNTVGFTATTVIKRSDFGMNALLPDLGNEVTIQIGAEAYQDKK